MKIAASSILFSAAFVSSFLMVVALQAMNAMSCDVGLCNGLEYGYYKKTCPLAEELVRKVVKKAILKDPGVPATGLGAGLIRMFFHDCFVRGCDASILLDGPAVVPGVAAEKGSPPSKPILQASFKVIEKAKKLIEHHCNATVSCADIVAFAAPDSFNLTGCMIDYAVPAGRLDRKVPHTFDEIKQLRHPVISFAQK